MRPFNFFPFVLVILALCFYLPAFAQNVQNLSTVRIDELSDNQIRQFIREVEAQGLTDAQLEQVALAKGMSSSEVSKLRERVNKIKQQDGGQSSQNKKNGNSVNSQQAQMESNRSRQLNFSQDSTNISIKDTESLLESLRPKVFGEDLFRNSKISFEPNLRLATPSNYQIGPDDQILIDIYGYSEVSYQLKVSPEGTINIPYVGVVQLSGLTMSEATGRIRSKLTAIYPNIRTGSTKVSISLGNIRSIKVTLLGEVIRPGTYTLTSLATVFNALYSSGGPSQNGSFRAIEVIRNNKVIGKVDIYDFLLRGYQRNNIRLQDQDVIRIPTYNKRVQFSGEVKRPYIFEALDGESLQNIIDFAGGFTTEAYSARIKVIQTTSKERRITDVFSENFSAYSPNNGDKYFAEPVLERYENRVSIGGAVFRPGQYQLEPGLTLSKLIRKAEGIKEDAFLPRGYINRLRADNSPELLSFDLGAVLRGAAADIQLQREDSVMISSIFDLREEYTVSVEGAVRDTGVYKYSENMSLEDLVIMAGGFMEGATPRRIEISRRVKDSEVGAANSRTAEVFQVDVDQNLRIQGPRFTLQPFDIVVVRNAAGYEVQRKVRIEGEVLYPGTYTITRKDERISDLVERAGGLTDLAYTIGASLKRTKEADQKSGRDQIDSSAEEKLRLMRFQKLQGSTKDSIQFVKETAILENDYVGINLERILDKPASKHDLTLQEGDILRIPRQLQTVKVSGEVLYPTTSIYISTKGFKQYVSDAGGFSDRSIKKRSYIIYANGSVRSTKKLFLFNNYPVVRPGAEIFVPKKAERNKLSAGELVGITSGIASLGAIIIGILNVTR